MAQPDFRYRAFISYRHAPLDRRWASWLLNSIETFRVPPAIAARTGSRLGRVYRDDDEIPASNDLGNEIETALRQSEFLIVVCSPDTPQSEWVRREIAFFRSLGREANILALLVDGEPSQSFPPELLFDAKGLAHEPIAADVRNRVDEKPADTQRRALLRILAGLLHVPYDDLMQRHQQRLAAQQRARIIGAVLGVLLLAGGIYAGITAYTYYNQQHADLTVTETLLRENLTSEYVIEQDVRGLKMYCTGQKLVLANTTQHRLPITIGEYQTDNMGDLAVLKPDDYHAFQAPPDPGKWLLMTEAAAIGPADPNASKWVILFGFATQACTPGQTAPA